MLEHTPYFVFCAFVAGYLWGKYRVSADSTTLYRTRRLSKKQERELHKGLQHARVSMKIN